MGKVFIASSEADQRWTEILVEELTSTGNSFISFSSNEFADRSLARKLPQIQKQVNKALFLLSPTPIRLEENPRTTTFNQNFLLALGFFAGALGQSNIAAIRLGDIDLPIGFEGCMQINAGGPISPGPQSLIAPRIRRELRHWLSPNETALSSLPRPKKRRKHPPRWIGL